MGDIVQKSREDNVSRQEGQEKATVDHADHSQKPQDCLLGRLESGDFKPLPDALPAFVGNEHRISSHEQASDSNNFVSSDPEHLQYASEEFSQRNNGTDSETEMSGDVEPLPD